MGKAGVDSARTERLLVTEGKPLRQLILVEPKLLKTIWPQVVPMFMEGKKHWEKFSTLESIYQSLAVQTRQLWLMSNDEEFVLAMLTEVLTCPKQKVLRIVWIGGSELSTAIDLFFDYIELWAARNGVSTVEVSGRKGWIRKLVASGYKLTRYTVAKDISGIREH